MRHHQRRALHLGDDLRHGVSLAGASGTQQHLVLVTLVDPIHQLADGFRLVTGGMEGSLEVEGHRRI